MAHIDMNENIITQKFLTQKFLRTKLMQITVLAMQRQATTRHTYNSICLTYMHILLCTHECTHIYTQFPQDIS